MSKLKGLSGVIPPLVTPLTDDRRIDEPGLRRLVGGVIEGGVHALFVMGSTGEFWAFSLEERRLAVEIVVQETGGRLPVFAGVGDSGTDLAARNASQAEVAGADAVVATLPYYYPTNTDAAAVDHFRKIADSTSLPLIVYNVPAFVKSVVSPRVVESLAREGIAAAVKDSSSDFEYFQDLVFRTRDIPGFSVFQGRERQTAASLFIGGHGSVPGIANIAPRLCVQLFDAVSAGRIEEGARLQERLSALDEIYEIGGSVQGALKAALAMMGICGPTTAAPIAPASDESLPGIRKIIGDFEVLEEVR